MSEMRITEPDHKIPMPSIILARVPRSDLARPCAIGRHPDPLPFHLLNHPGRAVVPDSESSLNHRDRGLPGFEHDPHRLVVKLIVLVTPVRPVIPILSIGVEN